MISAPKPGWYARLQGDGVDLDDWRHSLNEPFDPVAEKLPDGETVLRSADFEELEDASEVRERALVLIGRLNGALSIWNGTRPVKFGGVIRIDDEGKQHAWVFGEMAAIELGRFVLRATAVLLGPDGKPLPPPPPTPSQPQKWNLVAEKNDDVSDLLDHFGRADNWHDIYKTIEIAEHLAGSEHKLWKILGSDARLAKNLRTSANYYRHAKAYRPPKLLSLKEARPLLVHLAIPAPRPMLTADRSFGHGSKSRDVDGSAAPIRSGSRSLFALAPVCCAKRSPALGRSNP